MDTTFSTQDPQHFSLDAKTLTALGFQVDRDGITAHEDAANLLVTEAKRRQLSPVLVDVLSDRNEPAPARTRSFGKLAFALALQ